jgi:hypothetical protein
MGIRPAAPGPEVFVPLLQVVAPALTKVESAPQNFGIDDLEALIYSAD